MGAAPSTPPLGIDDRLPRLVGLFTSHGAVSQWVKMVLRHATVLSTDAIREQLAEIEDTKFYPNFSESG